MENNNQLQLANFEQAKELRDLGFDWPTPDFFNPDGREGAVHIDESEDRNWNGEASEYEGCVSRPSISLALKWFREAKGIHGWVEPYGDNPSIWQAIIRSIPTRLTVYSSSPFDSHDQAESALLNRLID